jgi:Pyridine nucleotide-disulphide oxidoreductase, dimerisation domain
VTLYRPRDRPSRLTEEQGRQHGIDVRTGITQVASAARGWIHKAGNDGFIKLVADAGRGVLIGATSTGPTGGEVPGALVVAIHAQVPISSLRTMIYAYPTFHRAISEALRNLGKKISPDRHPGKTAALAPASHEANVPNASSKRSRIPRPRSMRNSSVSSPAGGRDGQAVVVLLL